MALHLMQHQALIFVMGVRVRCVSVLRVGTVFCGSGMDCRKARDLGVWKQAVAKLFINFSIEL